jgi:DNA-binding response OmpR family regulator
MPSRRELGEILREADLITADQLKEALRLQKTYNERLASILVRQRVLTEKFAVTYLGRQIGLPAVDLSKTEIDLALLEVIPLELCQRHLVLPVRIEGSRVQLAMADPTDQRVTTEIEFKTGARITPTVALESSLKHAIGEARKAVKSGQKRLTANIQHQAGTIPVPAGAAVAPGSAAGAASASMAADAAAPPKKVQVVVDNDFEAPIFETLAGAPLTLKAPVATKTSLPGLEEMSTVLVIDDSEVALRLIESVLKKRSYGVITAKSGREGLGMMREKLPDLVILDGMLPEVHGFEICRQLKTSERFRHLPVMLLSAVHTGWRFAEDVKEKYGADEYMTKPFDAADLIRRVEALLNRRSPVPPQSEAAVRQHLKEGVAALKIGKVDDAITAFERGLAVDQFNDMLHYYLAMTLEKKERFFDACDHYEKAVQINPQSFDAITALANLYQRQEFWRKAREMWELSLAATKDEAVRARIKEHLLSLL